MSQIVRYLSHPQVTIDPQLAVPLWSLNKTGRERVALLARSGALAGTRHVICSGETKAVETATQGILDDNRSPSRKAGEPDNRHSHYWFARYWAEALAAQTGDAALAAEFAPLAKALVDGEAAILAELSAGSGTAANTGGYFRNDDAMTADVMRPSVTLNAIIG